MPSPPCLAQGRPAALDRLARLAASALGARAGCVTLLLDGDLRVAGAHGTAPGGPPAEECRRIVATGGAVAAGGQYAGVPVALADGSVIGTLCVRGRDRAWTAADLRVLDDIAASVVAELELHDAAERARHEQRIGAAVLDVATDCLIRIDASGRILGWSPSAEETFGWDGAGAIGRSLIDLLAPADLADGYREGLGAVVRGERPPSRRSEALAIHRDGRLVPVEISLAPTGPDTYMACVRDLTELRAAEERTEVAERRFRALVEHVPATIYSCDYDDAGMYHYVSPQIEELTGLPAEHFLGDPQRWLDAVHPDDRRRVAEQIEEDYRLQRGFEAKYRMVARDGTVRWVWDRESIVHDGNGDPVYGQGVVVDLTPMREAQEALESTRRRLASIIGVAPIILTAIDADGIVTYAGGRGLETLGVQPDDMVGRRAVDVTTSEEGRACVRRALRGETTSGTIVDEHDNAFDVSWQPVLGPDGAVRGVVCVAFDASARRRDEARARYLAHHDALTGAPNRALLELEIGERSGELAVIVVDVDGFRTVNDSLGHDAGDEVLCKLARRLHAVADGHGAFLARVGADEFALLVRAREGRCVRRDAERVADAALRSIRAPIAVAGSEFVMNAASGGAVGTSARDLLRHADIALGRAKLEGVALAWHVGEDDDEARGRLTLTARIHRALADGEFSLHYQPVYDLGADRVTGMEALIRWHDPARGIVSPDDFIPAAEASGLIDDIGRWVIDEVCRQWRAWADEGLHVAIAFNVAPRELRRADFAAELAAAIDRHGVDPSALVVEITERAAMREPARTDAVLRELQELGVRVAIDDFGADHSSLARLRALRVDMLKIDRDFLRGVPDEGDAAAIVTAVLSLAGALGMTSVAEGVETAEQLLFLKAQGCDRVQGYHVARPMTATLATAYLRRSGGAAARPALPEAA